MENNQNHPNNEPNINQPNVDGVKLMGAVRDFVMFSVAAWRQNPGLTANQILALLHAMTAGNPLMVNAWAILCFLMSDDTGLQWNDIVFPGIAVPRRPANYQFNPNLFSVWTMLTLVKHAFTLRRTHPAFENDRMSPCVLLAIFLAFHNVGIENIPIDDAETVFKVFDAFFGNVLVLEENVADDEESDDEDEDDEEESAEDADQPAGHEVMAQ